MSDSEEGKTIAGRIGVAYPGDSQDPRTWSGTPHGISRGLQALGYEVVGVNVEPVPALDFVTKNLIAVRRLHRTRKGNLKASLRLARAVARASPELAVLRTWWGKRALRRAGRLDALIQIGTGYSFDGRVPVLVFDDITVVQAIELGYPEWQVMPRRAVEARIERQRRVYERAVACCATTRWAADSIVRDYGIPAEKVFAVGVGPNHASKVDHRDWSSPRFLWIGTDWYGKNGDAVVNTFQRVRRERPTARLDLVGSHPEIDEEGVTGHGALHLDNPEHRARMSALLKSATCFVLPSRYEAAAIAYVEAGMAGLPSIATSVGGARELIGQGGRLFDPSDEDSLFEAMLELSDPETAERLGALARERAVAFTWPAVAERIVRAVGLPHPPGGSLADFL